MATATRDLTRQLLNLFGIPAAILFTVLWRPSVGSVAREREPLLAAAGWAFAIWGLIFVWQVLYAGYQALPSQRARPLMRRIGTLTVLNSLLIVVWTVAFTARQFAVALLTIAAMLGVLALIEVRTISAHSRGERWLVRAPFELNFGWVSVATILNATHFLWVTGIEGGPLRPVVWALVMLLLAGAVGVVMVAVRHARLYSAAVTWALAGIAQYRWLDAPQVAAVATAAAITVAAAIAIDGWQQARGPNSTMRTAS